MPRMGGHIMQLYIPLYYEATAERICFYSETEGTAPENVCSHIYVQLKLVRECRENSLSLGDVEISICSYTHFFSVLSLIH